MIGQGFYNVVPVSQIPMLLGLIPASSGSDNINMLHILQNLIARSTNAEQTSSGGDTGSCTCANRSVLLCRDNDEEMIKCGFNESLQ